MTGTIDTGTAPVVGATVSLWSTGTTAAQVGSSVVTDANGNFTLNFNCPTPATTLMYVMATGGHPAAGTASDPHIQLASALGPEGASCANLPGSIVVNELTTAAAAYALNGFAVPTTGSATIAFQGKSPGLDQAFKTLTNLDVPSTGAFENTGPETDQTTVQQTLDTLANAMAACNAASAGACAEFLSCATVNAAYVSSGQPCNRFQNAAQPPDTLRAALAVVQNAGTIAIQGIYDAGTVHGTPFSAVLGASPNDWTLPLIFSFTNFGPFAIDAGGHVWILSSDPNPAPAPAIPSLVVAEFDANFKLLSTGPHYFNGGGLASFDHTDLSNLAIDTAGDVWIGGSNSHIVELGPTGAALSGTSGFAAGNGPDGTAGVAIDSTGNAWFASGNTASTIFELSPAGALQSPSTGFAASNCPCDGITADSSGNVWTIGGGTAYLAEVNSAGVQNTAVRPGGAYGLGSTFYSLALDGSGNLWIADQHNHGVWQYEIATSTFVTTAGINYPNGPGPFSNEAAFNNATHPTSIAVDGAGHKWVANKSAGGAASVTELSADGLTNDSPDDGFGSGIIADAYVVAIDPSGNVWVTNGGTTITQFVGAGAPTRTPIASAVNSGFTP